MIVDELKKEQISSMKAKDTQRLMVLRYLYSQIKNYEIELRTEHRDLNDVDTLLVLKRQVKKRKKAIEQFKQGNRPDIVEKEEAELAIVEEIYNKYNTEA